MLLFKTTKPDAAFLFFLNYTVRIQTESKIWYAFYNTAVENT